MGLHFKRHCNLIVLLALVAALLILGFGDQRIVAYTTQSIGVDQTQLTALLYSFGTH